MAAILIFYSQHGCYDVTRTLYLTIVPQKCASVTSKHVTNIFHKVIDWRKYDLLNEKHDDGEATSTVLLSTSLKQKLSNERNWRLMSSMTSYSSVTWHSLQCLYIHFIQRCLIDVETAFVKQRCYDTYITCRRLFSTEAAFTLYRIRMATTLKE